MPKYEVQMYFDFGIWENVWHEGEDLMYFDTIGDAQAELDEYLADQHQAVDDGDMDYKYPAEDFRIVEVKHAETG